MPNENIKSYFHNGALNHFFQILLTLAPYSDSEFDFHRFKLRLSENIKTEFKNLFSFRRYSSMLERRFWCCYKHCFIVL